MRVGFHLYRRPSSGPWHRLTDAAIAGAALRCIPASLIELARRRVEDEDPRIRAPALEAVTRLDGTESDSA